MIKKNFHITLHPLDRTTQTIMAASNLGKLLLKPKTLFKNDVITVPHVLWADAQLALIIRFLTK